MDDLLQAILPEAPCGKDLQYDAAFLEFERNTQGASSHAVVGPDIPADGTNWRAVKKQATALLSLTKDLRVAVPMVKAALHTEGIPGLSGGTLLLRRLLELYWDSIHPQLEAEDSNNPLMRINALKGLCDRSSVLIPLRATSLVNVAGLGNITLRDIAVAAGELTPAQGAKVAPPTTATIEAAFAQVPIEQFRTIHAAVLDSLENLRAMERHVTDKVGIHYALSFEELSSVLERIDRELSSRLKRREAALAAATTQGNGKPDSSEHASDGGTAHGLAGMRPGEIASRADVVRMLDSLCEYYERHEPASPIPLLLKRAKRLVPMSFFDIVRDLAPAGVSQLETIRGPEGAEQS